MQCASYQKNHDCISKTQKDHICLFTKYICMYVFLFKHHQYMLSIIVTQCQKSLCTYCFEATNFYATCVNVFKTTLSKYKSSWPLIHSMKIIHLASTFLVGSKNIENIPAYFWQWHLITYTVCARSIRSGLGQKYTIFTRSLRNFDKRRYKRR